MRENYNLSANEYVKLAKMQGQTQRKLVEEIISFDYYARLSDTDKAKAIQYAYKYAKEYAQIEVLGRNIFSTDWMAEIDGNAAEMILRKVATGSTDKYTDLSIEAAAHVTSLLDNLSAEDGYTNVRDIQKLEAIVGVENLSDTEKDTVLRDIMGDSLEGKYSAAGELGVEMSMFVKSYRIYLDTHGNGKKQKVISYCIDTLGMSKTKAEKLYKLLSGSK